ncbi:hypothetical protein SELMODRAFT_92233, partial [Selaginella moellendorffii]
LYPPIAIIPRMALKDCYVDHLFIPKGLAVNVHNAVIHHSAEMWGEDSHEFNPDRFANGSLAACKHPMAFMALSFGARACVGRAYSQVQAKIIVASLLQIPVELVARLSSQPHRVPIVLTLLGAKKD